ncbi:MAG: rod shape-determining protein RodA [Candidatus Eisenbacteria bacterium]|uniref:Peptidoglycan glycosyltransferase RodA n=1 Tax=Eiseniibacteriota bacterium TaxID=2212470 RepID=A0A538UAP2_UNCEI|nr:MAG: rod shape-determining protein RodA [Candidatus Eisenbacteria bacterium]
MATRWRLPAIDGPLTIAALALVAIGLSIVFSATTVPGQHEGLWARQLVWFGFALGAAWLAAAIHYRLYDTFAYLLYGLSILLLVAVLGVGTSARGAKRWLDLGPIKFQPSELAKIATVFVLARRFDNRKLDLRKMRDWLPPLLITLVPFLLVAKEPDLGTSLSFPVILVAMYFWAGMPPGNLLLGLSPAFNVVMFFLTGSLLWFGAAFVVLLAVVRPRWPTLLLALSLNAAVAYAVPHLWDHMHDYQKRRIETFLNPGQDPHGAGYQIIQSKIAIGSGGLSGKGFLRGTQKGLAFLPMRHTDFIYSVVGEELGFLGALTVVILYAVVVLRGYRLALQARNAFASLMAVGLVSALFYHIIVNILMTIGWAPVTGLPLPLLSYGGTALIVNCVQLGLLQNVALRRQEY